MEVDMEEQQVLAGEGFQEGNKKIDMSLDDIIKLQKEESDPRPSSAQAGQNGNANLRRGRFFKGPARNQQGPGRPKLGFKQQRYPIGNTRNGSFGPVTRRRAAAFLSGVSPLNRPKNVQNFGQGQTQKMQPMTKKYRPSAVPLQPLSRSRNNLQNRIPQRRAGQGQQRTTAISQGRTLTQHITMNRNRRQLNTRRWQNNDGLGTTLTVSVPNPKANRAPQADRPALRRPAGRFGKTAAHLNGPPPKGVPLRFNFRAMANHTSVTLNERFSVLKIKGQFAPARRGGRTVTLA